jgi:hypothetical protein
MNGQSGLQIDAMFAENDHDAMEWIEKGIIKKGVLRARRTAKRQPTDE